MQKGLLEHCECSVIRSLCVASPSHTFRLCVFFARYNFLQKKKCIKEKQTGQEELNGGNR